MAAKLYLRSTQLINLCEVNSARECSSGTAEAMMDSSQTKLTESVCGVQQEPPQLKCTDLLLNSLHEDSLGAALPAPDQQPGTALLVVQLDQHKGEFA